MLVGRRVCCSLSSVQAEPSHSCVFVMPLPPSVASHVTSASKLVDVLKNDVDLLADPELSFLRSFIESFLLGSLKMPPIPKPEAQKDSSHEDSAADAERLSFNDPEVLAVGDVVDVAEYAMGPDPPPEDVSEADMDKASTAKMEAADLMAAGNCEAAAKTLTKAIQAMPSALTYARRAECFLKMKPKKPNAAIRDCDAALKLNPDSGKSLRLRGTAHRFLGNWEAASKDLAQGQAIDFDDAVQTMQKLVDERWHEIRSRRSAAAAAKRDAELEERRKAAAEAARKAEEAKSSSSSMPGMGGFPGGMPGMGGFPGGGMPPGMEGLMNDPELMAAMSNPKVMAAMTSAMSNPASLMQYMSDPEVGPVLTKLMGKMGGGMGGMPGGMGGMPGGGFGGAPPTGGGPTPASGPAADAGASAAPDNSTFCSVEEID